MKSGLFAFDQATTVGPGSVTNAMLANMAARTVKVNATNASASPQDLQGTTALTYLRVNASGNGLEWGALPVDPGLVTSVFGRTGAVVATNGDYTASQVTNVPAGNIAAVTVQAALNELDTEKVAKAGDTMTGPLVVSQNTAAAPTPLAGTEVQVVAADGASPAVELDAFGNAVGIVLGRRTGGTNASKTASASNDALLTVAALGYTGAAYAANFSASIVFRTSEAFTTGANGGRIQFNTQPNGTTAGLTARWIMENTGGLYAFLATGGDLGTGIVNATGLAENGTLLTAKYAQLAAANVFTAAQTININAAPAPTPRSGTVLQISGVDGASPAVELDAFGAAVGVVLGRRASGTNAAKTATANNDALLTVAAIGYDGANYGAFSGSVVIRATENFTAGAQGAKIQFNTQVNGAANTLVERWAVHNTGGLAAFTATGGDQGTGTVNAVAFYANGNLVADTNGLLRARVFTVGTLPSAVGIDAAKAAVTDALAPAFGATVAAGGAVHVPVYSDNAVWKVG